MSRRQGAVIARFGGTQRDAALNGIWVAAPRLLSASAMRLSVRLIISLIVGLSLLCVLSTLRQIQDVTHVHHGELERHARVLAESIEGSAEPLLAQGADSELRALADRFQNRAGLRGIAIYDSAGRTLAITPALANLATAPLAIVKRALRTGSASGQFLRLGGKPMHIFTLPLHAEANVSGVLAIFEDLGYFSLLRDLLWEHALISTGVQIVLVVSTTLLILRWGLGKSIQQMAHWLRDQRSGAITRYAGPPKEKFLAPLAKEVTQFATSLSAARAAAQEEARLRETSDSVWTSERLRVAMQSKLKGNRLLVVSNREPYEHSFRDGALTCSVPASGLITALEPVLQACEGTWIAQASGDGDRRSADLQGRIRVPPEDPQYTLRRVWLTPGEQQGFYFGFSNEGLWPLCHIAHTRPTFHAADWEHYYAVNAKFAQAALEEMRDDANPFVLVQDYHFALLPQMIKQQRPEARVALFWHIPWPNPEAFGICPWQRELLSGMLGADLVGFHIQAHCNNFLETVDRVLESRIDWARFAVERRDHLTAVAAFPISVAFGASATGHDWSAARERGAIFRKLGIDAAFLGVGVDRIDYTKGIPERFRAIERLLEQQSSYREKLTFVQIGAPSRMRINRYRDMMTEVEQEAARINKRFETGSWKPIVLLNRHHTHDEIQHYYRAAHFCLVTPLHDGMNLVAKEFVAARNDELGALILSCFAGASHELSDAVIVNPYDTDQLARAIQKCLEMPPGETRERMQAMRGMIREYNVYRWAGSLVGELARIRPDSAKPGVEEALRRADVLAES
jgi:trehalose-6-phosphate synthase